MLSNREVRRMELFCFAHMGGEIVRDPDIGTRYKEGLTISKMVKEGTTLDQLTSMLETSIGDEVLSKRMKFMLKFDPHVLLDLVDDAGVMQRIQYEWSGKEKALANMNGVPENTCLYNGYVTN